MADAFPNKLPLDLWSALHGIRSVRTYSKGRSLFQCGRPAQGVYLIEKGEVRLLFPSSSGAGRVFETAGPGVMLGLSETMCGEAHKLTAEAAGQTRVSFVGREELLRFLRQDQRCCMQIVRLLSEDLHLLYHKFQAESGSVSRPRKSPPRGPRRKGKRGLKSLRENSLEIDRGGTELPRNQPRRGEPA